MKRVVLIGCGNIGTRLLQSLVSLPLFNPSHGLSVTCIDPDPNGLARAEERINEVFQGDVPSFITASFSKSFQPPEAALDLAIVATTSRPRFEIVKSLLEQSPPRRLVLEKFLFVQPAAYEVINELLNQQEVQCWVHAPRPAWPGYAALKTRIKDSGPVHFRVRGSAWAMASNAVHFIAAFNDLTREEIVRVDASKLDPDPIPNKRESYLEVTGQLNLTGSKGSELELVCRREGHTTIAVDIMTDAGHYTILEGEQRLLANDRLTNWAWREEAFETLFASQMQTPLTEILEQDACALPSYQSMIGPHQDLIKVFNRTFFGKNSESRDCPVT